MSLSDGPSTVIVDFGSTTTKAGFAGDECPILIMPSVLGVPKYPRCLPVMKYPDFYIGDDAQRHRGILSIQYPMEQSRVKDWNAYEKIMDYIFSKGLGINCSENSILLPQPVMGSRADIEIIVEMMFETFNFASLYMIMKPVLVLYACARLTGSILYSGGGVTSSTTIYDGYMINSAVNRENFGGNDITNYLIELLKEKNYHFKTSAEKEIAREIKESLCRVSKNLDMDLKMITEYPSRAKKYILPDGQVVNLSEEIYKSPEIMFTPSLVRREEKGVHDMLIDSIFKSDIDLRRDLFSNIVIAGGNTMFSGYPERFKKELSAKVSKSNCIYVVAATERNFGVWIGGSILASLSSCKDVFIQKSEYEASGPNVVHQKCFL